MLRCVLFFVLAAFASSAEKDAWTKVRDLTSGTELRIYKHGSKQPVAAKMDQANADSLVVVVKNEQISISKEQIDRIDYRPSGKKHVTTETKTSQEDPNTKVISPSHPQGAGVPGQSSSSNVSFGKPEFETIYRK